MKIRENFLPVLRPVGGREEIESITESIHSGWWGKGPKVEEFETKFAKMVGAKYAVAINSNTSGQDLILKALGIKDCDIISPTISFITTAVVPLWNNCTSNIVDVNYNDLNINPNDVKKNLRANTKAIIAVNYAGVLSPIEEIRKFYDGLIIEDCAHSCYTEGAGSRGDAAVWSFQAVKTMPCGDGGMITTNDKELYEKLIPLTWMGITSSYGRSKNKASGPGYSWEYNAEIVGYKAYMIDLIAAIALEQMKKLPKQLAIRRAIQSKYNKNLSNNIRRPFWSETCQHYPARVDAKERDKLINYLADKRIGTSVHYKPLHKHGVVSNMNQRDYQVADNEWLKLITLPCHPAMTDDDVNYVIYWVNSYFNSSI